MNDNQEPAVTAADQPAPNGRQPWTRPTVESLDVAESEASYAGAGADFGPYS